MKLFQILILILFTRSAFAQSDLDLIHSVNFKDSTLSSKRKVTYVFKKSNWFVKYNPVSLVLGGALFFYQGVISPQIMQGCAFEPSCSAFSKQCIHQFGLVKGMALSADRLTRCTRLSAIDFHPVMFNSTGHVNDLPEYYRLREKK